eukprot:1107462-Pyramimonas_sp.AAC.1
MYEKNEGRLSSCSRSKRPRSLMPWHGHPIVRLRHSSQSRVGRGHIPGSRANGAKGGGIIVLRFTGPPVPIPAR